MADGHYEDKDFFIRNCGEYPVVPNPVTPEPTVASQRFSRRARIREVQVLEVTPNSGRNRSVEFADLFVNCWRKAKPIGH
jgi:hypothetical protein